MNLKSLNNNESIAKSIKKRRIELGLTIEEAAYKANVGTKTWSRYESGNPIRRDKLSGVLRALKWTSLTPMENNDKDKNKNKNSIIAEYKKHEFWSDFIESNFGVYPAISFCIGADILSDYLDSDLDQLSKMPKGSHIGQLDYSMLADTMPKEFLMEYDYNFMYKFKRAFQYLVKRAISGNDFIAHKPIEEIILFLIVNESEILMSDIKTQLPEDELDEFSFWDEWAFDLFDDCDVVTFLFSDLTASPVDDYQFKNWFENIFYM